MAQRRTDLTDLGRLIISAMQDVCVLNKDCPTARTPFHSIQIPPMTLHDYAKRIFKYSQCTEECFPFALILVNRYLMRQPANIKLSFYNSHRLFITSLMIAAKLRDDEYYSNAYYSSIGGVSPLEMNALEVQFLKDIQWDLYIDPEEFYSVVTACEENLYAEKMEHETRKFREQREKEKAQGSIGPIVAGSTSATVASPTSHARVGEVPEKLPKAQNEESGDSSGGLSSSDSRAANTTLSTVSSGQDVTMFMSGRGASAGNTTGGGNGHEESGEFRATPTTRTPTKAYFDPMNYSTVPSTGSTNSPSSAFGKKRKRNQ
jgi:hypothetical protein